MRIPENAALLVIDVQKGFDHPKWGERNNPQAEKNIGQLLQSWREAGRPIFHVRHLSLQPGSVFAESNEGSQIKETAQPIAGEPVILKNVNSAFIGTTLQAQLTERGIRHLVITGMTTDHCVSTTARMAANLGFEVFFVGDACATFERNGPDGKHYTAQQMHDVNLASLSGEFVTVVDTQSVLGSPARIL